MKYFSTSQEPREFYVQPGEYTVRVIEATETVSKNGTDMIKLNLEVEDHGCRLFDYLVASEKSAWKIDAFRRAIGEEVHEEAEAEIHPGELVGKTARAKLKTEEYNGTTGNKVDLWIVPAKPKQALAAQEEEEDNEPF